jgi:hypothetical protein
VGCRQFIATWATPASTYSRKKWFFENQVDARKSRRKNLRPIDFNWAGVFLRACLSLKSYFKAMR